MARRTNETGHDEQAAAGPTSVARAVRATWWLPLLRGLVLIALGLLLMVEQLAELGTVEYVFAAFLLADGVIVAVQGLANRRETGWRWWLAQGVVDVLFAALIVLWPSITGTTLFYLLVVWALVLGVLAVIGAASLARNRDLAWPWLLTFGLVSTLFGFLLVTRSENVTGTLEVTTLVFAIYAFVTGSIHLVSAFSVRSVAQDIDRALGGESPVLDAIVARREAAERAAAERADARAAAREEAKRREGGVIHIDDSPRPAVPGRASGDAERAQPGVREELVPDERHDVEHRVRDDER